MVCIYCFVYVFIPNGKSIGSSVVPFFLFLFWISWGGGGTIADGSGLMEGGNNDQLYWDIADYSWASFLGLGSALLYNL